MSLLILTMVLAGAPAVDTDAEEFTRAETLVAQFRYAEVKPLLARLRATSDLPREKLLRVLELQGVVAGQLRQSGAAVAAFKELFVLRPEARLSGEYAPRVTTPFLEAKGWVATAGPLTVDAVAKKKGASVVGLELTVSKDVLGLADSVRFHVAGESSPAEPVPLDRGHAATPVTPAESLTWWAELLGAHREVLLELGTEKNPREELASKKVVVAEVEPVVTLPVVQPPPSVGLGGARVAALVLGGVAVASAGAGLGLGLTSEAKFNTVLNAKKEGDVYVGLSQVQAEALNNEGKSLALGANVLFIGAGVLGVTGVILWLVGAPPSTQVAVVPTPNGMMVTGSFP